MYKISKIFIEKKKNGEMSFKTVTLFRYYTEKHTQCHLNKDLCIETLTLRYPVLLLADELRLIATRSLIARVAYTPRYLPRALYP